MRLGKQTLFYPKLLPPPTPQAHSEHPHCSHRLHPLHRITAKLGWKGPQSLPSPPCHGQYLQVWGKTAKCSCKDTSSATAVNFLGWGVLAAANSRVPALLSLIICRVVNSIWKIKVSSQSNPDGESSTQLRPLSVEDWAWQWGSLLLTWLRLLNLWQLWLKLVNGARNGREQTQRTWQGSLGLQGCRRLSSPTLEDTADLRLPEEEQEFLRKVVETRSFCGVSWFLSEAHCQQQQWG